MPLRAFIEDQEIIAPLMDDEAWEALRLRVTEQNLRVVLPCCDVEGYLRKSKYGTKHFAHKQNAECAIKSETVEHLRAKADIVLACKAAGYQASPEVAGEDWRADVMATRGAVRIAFEVQWSFLRLSKTLMRQRRYERDNVRGCWFFRRPPAPLHRGDDIGPELEARQDLPLFHLYVNADGSFNVALNNRLNHLSDFVEALLTGQIRFCKSALGVSPLRLRAVFFEMDCPECRRRSHLYFIDTTQEAACGVRFKPDADWYSTDYAFHPVTLNALKRYRETERGARLRMAEIKPRHSPREGISYLSFGCHACDAIFDHDTVDLALYGSQRFWEAQALDSFDIMLHKNAPVIGSAPHWCFPDHGRFCCAGS
jgi:hypothetical protein